MSAAEELRGYSGGSPVLVDPREGSGNVLPMLQELGIPSQLTRLPYGDIELVGRGPEGRPVVIGIEIKTVGDLVKSLADGRLTGHQLPGLVQRYELVYLVIEGQKKPVRIEDQLYFARHGDFTFDEIEGRLTSIEEMTGVRRMNTVDRRHTAEWVAAKYRWWNGKEFEQHRSHLQLHRRTLDGVNAFDPPGVSRRMKVAMALADGMGPTRARAVADHFRSVREMVDAGFKQWLEIEGIGRKMAFYVTSEIGRTDS